MSDKSAYIKMLCGTRHALKEAQAYQTKEFLGGKDKNEIRNRRFTKCRKKYII